MKNNKIECVGMWSAIHPQTRVGIKTIHIESGALNYLENEILSDKNDDEEEEEVYI